MLTAPEDGALIELEVALHDRVSKGDIVARMDPGPLMARSQVLAAELEALSRSEVSTQQGRTRLFERDHESARFEVAELAGRIEESRARAAALREKLAIDEQLAAEGVIAIERASNVRREIGIVEARLAADQARLSLARRQMVDAGVRAETVLGPNQWQVTVARRRLAELEEMIDRLALRSSTSGQITQVFRSVGEWLKAGEPVMRVSSLAAREAHAWLGGSATPLARIGQPAEIRRQTASG